MNVERKSPPVNKKDHIRYHEILSELFLGYHSDDLACHRELLNDIGCIGDGTVTDPAQFTTMTSDTITGLVLR